MAGGGPPQPHTRRKSGLGGSPEGAGLVSRRGRSRRAAPTPNRTADEYAVWLIQLMAMSGLAPSDIDATIIGSVVPEATFNLVRLCQRYFSSEPLMVGRSDCFLGIGIDVDMPKEEVGADRVANAVAVQDRYQPPLIALDFGTATTFDIIDRLGNYCGG